MEARGLPAAEETCISMDQDRSSYQTIDNIRNVEVKLYQHLLDAAMGDKWELVRDFIIRYPSSVGVPITLCGRTALHTAVGAGHCKLVLKLLEFIPIEALELKDSYNGNTALHLAVIAGLEDVVKAMVQKDRNLTSICNKKGLNPLLNAAIHVNVEHREIFRFLSGVMKDEESSSFQGHLGAHLICSITRAGLYELAYTLIREHPSLATAREDNGHTMLDVLAEKGSARRLASAQQSALYFQLSNTQQYKYIDKPSTFIETLFHPSPKKQALRREQLRSSIILPALVNIIFEEVSHMTKEDMRRFFFNSNFLKTAAKTGAVEIVKGCISTYPDLLWFPHEGRGIIFRLATENRQANIFDYLYGQMNADEKILTTSIIDSNGGNILHVAAKIAPPSRLKGCPVNQMQKEISWFKKVKKTVPPALARMRNDQGETPEEVFTREHKNLVKKAEENMLRTSESSLIVGALVATVAFAAAFTVPGGNFSDSDANNKGKPIFLGRKKFIAFMVVDALALFSSAYSIQVFLSAFGRTRSEATFETVIPRKLIFGLISLRISVVCVMIAFCIALSIMLGNTYVWAPYLIGGIACICCSPSFEFG